LHVPFGSKTRRVFSLRQLAAGGRLHVTPAHGSAMQRFVSESQPRGQEIVREA
jgi:hypothetical protein